jgi:hypothetical protein
MSPPSLDWQPSPTWVPNPDYPDYNEDQVPIGTATCVAFSCISLLTLVARLLARWRTVRKLGIDDLIIFIPRMRNLIVYLIIVFPISNASLSWERRCKE